MDPGEYDAGFTPPDPPEPPPEEDVRAEAFGMPCGASAAHNAVWRCPASLPRSVKSTYAASTRPPASPGDAC